MIEHMQVPLLETHHSIYLHKYLQYVRSLTATPCISGGFFLSVLTELETGGKEEFLVADPISVLQGSFVLVIIEAQRANLPEGNYLRLG